MLNNSNNNDNVAGPMRQQTNGSRSVFARIMSTENIQVIFDPKSKDAWFDTKTRVLNMPSWTNMTPEVYDLLLSHEVSHALHTPTGGWIGTVDELVGVDASEADKQVARQYLNIIEDARIERLIKAKYPGLARDYRKGYEWMVDNKVFGDAKKFDLTNMNFIDRINLHFKIGHHTDYTVPFTPEEQDIVDMVENARTFEDVQKVTRLVWDHAKGEASNAPQPQSGGSDGEGDGQDGEPTDGDGKGKQVNNTLNPMASKTAKAQQNFLDNKREKRSKYDNTTDSPIVMPNYNLSKVIVPHTVISNQINDAIGDCTTCADWLNESRSEMGAFISEAKSTVDAMVKAFLLKKAAAAHHRQQQAKTGTLDCNLLSTYKWNEDLFKHFTVKPNGKNHGFIVHLDWSGSMGGLILNVVKQMYILTSFFRKIGVPYDVYAFSSHKPAGKHSSDYNEYAQELGATTQAESWQDECKTFITNGDDPMCPHAVPFYLYHFASSTMNAATHKDMMEKVWMLAYNMNPSSGNYSHRAPQFPYWLQLGDTPLDHALCASVPLVKAFQQKNRVEIMNVVAITDGSTSGSPLHGSYWSSNSNNTRLVNRRTGSSYDLTRQYSTNVCASYLKDETGCNTMMIYLSVSNTPNDRIPGYTLALPNGKVVADPHGYWNNDPAKDALQKHWADENYLIAVPAPVNGYDTPNVAEPCGFDAVFAIKMPRKAAEDAYEDLDMTNTTYTRLKSQFVKSLSRKIVSRGLVNRMVEVVAKHT